MFSIKIGLGTFILKKDLQLKNKLIIFKIIFPYKKYRLKYKKIVLFLNALQRETTVNAFFIKFGG